MLQVPCPLTRYYGVGSGKTTGPSKPRRGSFERCVPTRCPGVGWASLDSRLVLDSPGTGCYRGHVLLPGTPGSGGHPSTADSWRPGASLDATGAMSSYPASRGRVVEDDSSVWKDRRVAGCRRRAIVLPENTGSGRGAIAFVTCYMCLGVSLRQKAGRKCQDTFGHVPLNIATICACWSNPDSRILCWSVNLR